jgi:hypothetical protein
MMVVLWLMIVTMMKMGVDLPSFISTGGDTDNPEI